MLQEHLADIITQVPFFVGVIGTIQLQYMISPFGHICGFQKAAMVIAG